MGKDGMEATILEEARKLVEMLKEGDDLGQETCLKLKMNIPILNALWVLITGEKMEYKDKRLMSVVQKVDKMMTSVSRAGRCAREIKWQK